MQKMAKILKEIHAIKSEPDSKLSAYSTRGIKDILIRRVESIIRMHMNDDWINVKERLPEKEAKEFIDEELNGIGHLYPCLLTYKSSNTERVHVVEFYYDVHEHWFVNAGGILCEKDRCIAWQPLPEPFLGKGNEKS